MVQLRCSSKCKSRKAHTSEQCTTDTSVWAFRCRTVALLVGLTCRTLQMGRRHVFVYIYILWPDFGWGGRLTSSDTHRIHIGAHNSHFCVCLIKQGPGRALASSKVLMIHM